MSEQRIASLVKKVNCSDRAKSTLTVLSYIATVCSVVVFIYMLINFALQSALVLVSFFITLGVPFVLVSLLRRVIKAPRPYELYDFLENPVKNSTGNSFPSRHSFSIFAIGALCLFVSLPVGIITLALGVVLCFCRVALGLHFVRDVLAGALVGLTTSLIGGFVFIY